MYPQYNINPMFQMQNPGFNQQFNQYRQQNIPESLGGKVVDSVEVVKVTDVPMDGQTYYFPKADGTEIYSKRWLNNGTTQILTYKTTFEPQTSISTPNEEKREFEQSTSRIAEIQNKISVLEERIENLEVKKSKKKVDLSDTE